MEKVHQRFYDPIRYSHADGYGHFSRKQEYDNHRAQYGADSP